MLRDACHPVYRILNDPSAASLKRPLSTKRPEFLESEGETEVCHVGIEARLEESKAY